MGASLSRVGNSVAKDYKFPIWIFAYLLVLSAFSYGGFIEIIQDIAVGSLFIRPVDVIFFASALSFGLFLFRRKPSELSKFYVAGVIISAYFAVHYLYTDKAEVGSVGMITSVLSFWVLFYVGGSNITLKNIRTLDIIAQLGLLIYFVMYINNLIGFSAGHAILMKDEQYMTLRAMVFTRRQGFILQLFAPFALGFNIGALLLLKLKRMEKLLRMILMIIFIVSLDISLRGNYLFLFTMTILTFFFLKNRGKHYGLYKIVLPSLVGGLLLLLFLNFVGKSIFNIDNLVGTQFRRVGDIFFAVKGEDDIYVALNSRLFYWLEGLQVALRGPAPFLFGKGYLLFPQMSPLFATSNPHNFIIESMLVFGSLGFALLFVFIWLPVLRRAIKLERLLRNNNHGDVLIFAVFVLLLRFVVGLLVQSAFFERDIMIFFYASCGILFAMK